MSQQKVPVLSWLGWTFKANSQWNHQCVNAWRKQLTYRFLRRMLLTKCIFAENKVWALSNKTSYEFIIDHRSYTHNLSSCEIKAWKEIQAWTGFELVTSAIPVQCSTDWAIKPSECWSLCEFVIYRRRWRMQMNIWKVMYLNCEQRYAWTYDWSSQF